MSNILKIVLCTCAFMRFYVMGDAIEDLKQKYADTIMLCSNDYPLTTEHLEQLKEGKLPDDKTVHCLFACTYKKLGMMDKKGMLSVDGLRKISQKYWADNPEKIKNSDDFTQACISVNDEPVSDGEKGCERAALIFKCSIQKAGEYDFL